MDLSQRSIGFVLQGGKEPRQACVNDYYSRHDPRIGAALAPIHSHSTSQNEVRYIPGKCQSRLLLSKIGVYSGWKSKDPLRINMNIIRFLHLRPISFLADRGASSTELRPTAPDTVSLQKNVFGMHLQ